MWITSWQSIERRIEALEKSMNLFFQSIPVSRGDCGNIAGKFLIPEAKEIRRMILDFKLRFGNSITIGASDAIAEFIGNTAELFSQPSQIEGAQATCLSLISVKASLNYQIRGTHNVGKSITERAFEHLRRMLVADELFREKWISAFEKGEEHCEKLGAVHLLHHGIWAFKINAIGERTDLVYGNPIELGAVERTSPFAIILTEWKLANSKSEIEKRFNEAQKQAALYAKGSLSNLEISETRYLVVISKEDSLVDESIEVDNFLYRNILLPLNPLSPSNKAKIK